MRITLPHRHPRRVAITLTATLAAALLVAPTAALAVEADDEADSLQSTQPVHDVCDDVLLVVSPDHVEGNEAAVAITSQAVDLDVEGWLHVSWQAAAGTQLTAITVHQDSGTWTLVDDLDSGTLDNVLELTFCGTASTVVEVLPDDEADADGDAAAEDGTDDTGADDAAGQDGTGEDGTAPATTDTATTAVTPVDPGDDSDADATGDGEAADLAAADDEAAADGDADAATTDEAATTDDPADDDVEVLGVQLTRDDDGAGSGGPILAWLVMILGLVGAGTLGLVLLRARANGGRSA